MSSIWPRHALFNVVGSIAGYLALLVVAFSISSGLYFVAELAEEYPTRAGRVLKWSLGVVMFLHVLLWLDGLPLYESFMGILCHCAYCSMLQAYPFVELVSVQSVLSALAFLVSHYVWFQYFLDNISDAFHIVGFFLVFVWLVPCGLFVSLSISENTLPGLGGGGARFNSSSSSSSSGSSGKGGKTNLFKSLYDTASSFSSNVAGRMGLSFHTGGGGGKKKRDDDRHNSSSIGGASYGGYRGGESSQNGLGTYGNTYNSKDR